MTTNLIFALVWVWFGIAWYWYVLALALLTFFSSSVLIRERQVGIVVKRFSRSSLEAGRLIALNGEAGYQADTLAPGLRFGYWRWQYRIIKVPVTVVAQGEIALVVAADGAPIPAERILGKVGECGNFQDARKLLVNGGAKARKLGILAARTYRMNTAHFNVIRAVDAEAHGMYADQHHVSRVNPDMVGIVTTLDGRPIDTGEIAGPAVAGHDNFQNAHAF